MPNDAQTADETAASTMEHDADAGGTVVQLQPSTGALPSPPPEADDRPTVCPLKVGERDERGNAVEYIYARDPHYIVYFSRPRRLDAADAASDDASGHRGGAARRRRWWPFARRAGRTEGDPTDTWKGVQAQLSNDPTRRRAQRRNLLGLGVERAKLQALLSDWPRRLGYDASIAIALQMALDGDGTENDPSAKQALETLSDARASLLGEREVNLRAQYVSSTLRLGVVGFLMLMALHLVLPARWITLDGVWIGCEAGLIGAILSIAIGLRRRTVALDIGIKGNRSDCILRLIIGAVSGGTLVLLFASGLLPKLATGQGVMDHQSIAFSMLLGVIGGFVEQLVPSLLEEQGNRFGNDTAAKPQPAGSGRKADDEAKKA